MRREPVCDRAARGRPAAEGAPLGVGTAGSVRAGAWARRFRDDAAGATAIEYAMIAGLVFLVAAGGIRAYGSKMNNVYDRIGNAISQAN